MPDQSINQTTHVIVGDHDPEPRVRWVVPYRNEITGLMCYDDENGHAHEWRPRGVHFPGREPTASEII